MTVRKQFIWSLSRERPRRHARARDGGQISIAGKSAWVPHKDDKESLGAHSAGKNSFRVPILTTPLRTGPPATEGRGSRAAQ